MLADLDDLGAQGNSALGVARDECPALDELRERFLEDPAGTELAGLRPAIAGSWRRSIAWQTDVDQPPVSRQPAVDRRVLDSAEASIRMLLWEVDGRGGCVVVADRFGTVATVRGSRGATEWAKRCFASPGATLAEDVAGTNCIGTAIEDKRGLTVAGSEHLSSRLTGCWSSSALVLDPLRHSVRAVLAVAVPLAAVGALDREALSALVDRAAGEIVAALAAKLAAREQALLTAYLRQLGKRGSRAVIAIDGKTTIANRPALELIGSREQSILAAYARDAQCSERPPRRELSLADGSTIVVGIEVVHLADEPIGCVFNLTASNEAGVARRLAPSNRRADPFVGLVGENPAFARALEIAHRRAERRMPVHIIGEPGTGKGSLARAIATAWGDQVNHLDGLDLSGDEDGSRFRLAAEGGRPTVIAHADLVPDATWKQVMACLNGPCPSLVLTARRLSEDVSAFARAIGSTEIRIPDLRARRDDVPALVSSFLVSAGEGPERVSPQLLKALTEADLPRNVGELRDIVETAARRCSTRAIGTDDLTPDHRQALVRTALSPLQAAELAEIREALRKTRGNRLQAAKLLHIGRTTLYRRLDLYERLGFDL